MTAARALAPADAARILCRYHLREAGAADVIARLTSVQYDPLAPVGRNVDLVFQARDPTYRVDDWQRLAYTERRLIDAWDKQASLVAMPEWSAQGPFFDHFAEGWRRHGIDVDGDEAAALANEVRERGPATSLELGDQRSDPSLRGSWYGPKRTRRVLRALWDSGRIVTHHRVSGRHAYAAPELVLSEGVLGTRWPRARALERLVERRVQASGLARRNADASFWFLPCARDERDRVATGLTERGRLVELDIGGARWWATPAALAALEQPAPDGVRFLAPLDPLLWDRAGVRSLFGFDYVWEVYKPAAARRWGYYVLPVVWRERFVARFDARVEDRWLRILAWHWEADLDARRLPAGLADDLALAAARFLHYLGRRAVRLSAGLGRAAREAWQAAARGAVGAP